MPAGIGKIWRHLDETPACVGDTMTDDHFEGLRHLWQVPCQRITHLDRRFQCGYPFGEDDGQILSGMLTSGKEQGDMTAIACGDNAAGEDACPSRLIGLILDLPAQAQHRHRRVIVVQHAALRRLADQFVENGFDPHPPWRRQSPTESMPATESPGSVPAFPAGSSGIRRRSAVGQSCSPLLDRTSRHPPDRAPWP